MPKREFAVERQARQRRQERVLQETFARKDDGGPEVTVALDPSGVSNAELLQSINDLAFEVLGEMPAPAGAKGNASTRDVRELREEVARLTEEINRAQAEIAALHHPTASANPLPIATVELGAIVQSTETATNRILDANDGIERAIHEIASTHHADKDVMAMTDEIAGHVIAILESCNFQDLTGQRMVKVANTIRFAEERAESVIAIWGNEAFAHHKPAVQLGLREREDVVPMASEETNPRISQQDIDALFD